MRRILTILSAGALLASSIGQVGATSRPDAQNETITANDESELEAVEPTLLEGADSRLKDAEPGLFIVRLADEPVASYEGDQPGLRRTKPRVERGERLTAESPSVRAYRSHLAAERASVIDRIEETIGRGVAVDYVYDVVINGFAAFFTPDEAIAVAALREVVDVEPEVFHELHTDNGPAWIGADSVWGDGSNPELETRGEGVIVGVIDSGINPSNPSFAGTGPVDGYEHTNPFGADTYVGVCNPAEDAYDPDFPCNDKLIGAWDFVIAQTDPSNSAVDVDGHGSHTASTAAGNVVDVTVLTPATPGLTLERQISGVAPHANIISYRGCGAVSCPNTATNAAIQQAVIDGVDVINYSIGGGSQNPWTSSNAIAFLNARDAGVFVATSAGNSGPGAGTAGSPGDAPWLLTVGASTHDRNISNTLTGFTGGESALADIIGKGFTGPYGPAPILYAGDFDDPLCLEPFAPGTFIGEIVICDRGIIARVEKGANVLNGGAGGMILGNDAPSAATLNSDPHVLPAVHISHADSLALKAWLSTGSDHAVAISGVDGVDEDPVWADIMAAFSSRGPNQQIDIITPSITGPGLDIIAAYGVGDPDPAEWSIVSGTSMSSPHAAGAGALLTALHPTWTPDQIQAALMTTAVTDGVLKEDAQTPADWFDMGAGRIDLAAASQAGFVLDETQANYLAANPLDGGDPKSLNLPNLANSQCLAVCSWTRTITATTDATWSISTSGAPGLDLSVSPSGPIALTEGQTQVLTITADVTAAEQGEWLFGDVVFTSAEAPRAHFPVAIIGTGGVLPTVVQIDTRRDAGSQLVSGLEARESPNLTVDVHGLTAGTLHTDALNQDPTRSDPYSNLDEVWYTTFSVADSVRLVAEIVETTSPDIDLFVGTGGTPSAATEVCASTTPSSAEYCDVGDPADGTWWVLVQNWQGSTSQPDPFTLAIGVVPAADVGTMSVDAPPSAEESVPFDVRVFWDAEMQAGQRWYGAFTLSSGAGSTGDVGRVPVDLVRHDDDVAKTADVETAQPGDTVTYEITVAPNVTPTDLEYTITDTIPEGLTYVEDSVTGGATVEDGVVSWTGTMPTPATAQGSFSLSTNATDESCAVPFGAGTWVDFQALGFGPAEGFDGGDNLSGTLFASGAQFNYYGHAYTGLNAAPVGTAMFAPPFGNWWIPQHLPSPTAPNAVVAGLWGDFEWVYDAETGTGFRALALGTGETGWAILDHHGMELYGGSSDSWSVQQWIRRTPAASGPSVVFAYHDLGSLNQTLTVGVENPTGSAATALVNAGPATGLISDSTIVCFTWAGPTFEPHVITYEVTVDNTDTAATATNEAVHTTDNPGSQPAVVSTDLMIVPPLAEHPVSYPAVFRDGTWFLRDSNTADPGTVESFAFGDAGDHPIFGDWNGDGVVTPGVVRVTGGSLTWFLRNSNTSGVADITFSFGDAADTPIVGDWNGDGTDTIGLVRGNWWLLRNSNSAGDVDLDFFWGDAADHPIVGDWNGDGTDTIGLLRGANWWLLRNSNSAGDVDLDFFWGALDENAWVVGDWNGDGMTNPGILRGNWWLLRAENSDGPTTSDFFFGMDTDRFAVWAKLPEAGTEAIDSAEVNNATQDPEGSEALEGTTVPNAIDAPDVTEIPDATDALDATETPGAAEELEPTESPEADEAPDVEEGSTSSPSPTGLRGRGARV